MRKCMRCGAEMGYTQTFCRACRHIQMPGEGVEREGEARIGGATILLWAIATIVVLGILAWVLVALASR
jgi:hypothetical protein